MSIRQLLAFLTVTLLGISLQSCAFNKELFTGIDEATANQMVAILRFHDLTADKIDKGKEDFAVTVDTHQFSEAVELLHEWGLPRDNDTNLGKLFQSGGLVPTNVEEQIRFIHGVSQELTASLNLLTGVVRSRVHIALASIVSTGPRDAKDAINTASVFLYYDPSRANPVDLIPRIRSLVSNGVPYLKARDVVVLTQPLNNFTLGNASPPKLVRFGTLELRQLDVPYIAVAFGTMLLLTLALSVALVVKLFARN